MRQIGPKRDVRELLSDLVDQLREHGVEVLDGRAYRSVGLLIMPGGLPIWCYGWLLRWKVEGEEVTWPAADAYGAARRLAELVHERPAGP